MRPLMRTLAEQLDPRHTALLIIDMQNDFLAPGFGAERAGRDLAPARRVIPDIARLLAAARAAGVAVAHVGFWTLPGHGSDSDTWLVKRQAATVSAPDLCLADTPGAAFIDELAPAPGEWQVRKHRYSAFTATNLDLLLRARDIRTLVITGVSTNACVESSFRAGFELGYAVVVPPDGCASWSATLHEAALENVRHRFGQTPGIDEILSHWTR